MPKLSIDDSPAVPDLALVHWMQVAVTVGTLMYILNSRPDLTHSVHQVAQFVHNQGPAEDLLMSRHLIISYIIWLGLQVRVFV
jgi:hypothetical protein